MAGRYRLIAAKRLDLWSRLSLRLDLGAKRPLRIGLPLLPVARLLWSLSRCGLDLRLNGRLCRRDCLSLLPLLSLRPGLRLGLCRRGRRSRRRLNLSRRRAAMSALAPVGPGRLLLRIGSPVRMFAAAAIVWLRQCRRTRNQNGDGGRDKSGFHEITQSMKGGLQIV